MPPKDLKEISKSDKHAAPTPSKKVGSQKSVLIVPHPHLNRFNSVANVRQDWHTDPYPCTVPRCVEIVKIVGQFKELPTEYQVPKEPKYEFYAIVIGELKAQREAMAIDSGKITQQLSDVFEKWKNKHDAHLDSDAIKAVARMKIHLAAWVETVEEIEGLNGAQGQPPGLLQAAKPKK